MNRAVATVGVRLVTVAAAATVLLMVATPVALRPASAPPPSPAAAISPPAVRDVPRAAPTPTPATRPERVREQAPGLDRSTPTRLRIDALGVDTDLVGLGLENDGTMQVPSGAFPAGWYRGAPSPGELGPAIIVGHVDWGGVRGVFADLHALRAGDEVAVTREDGTTVVFTVTGVLRVAKDRFPTMAVYGDLDHPGLRLVTCGGAFDDEAARYQDNVIAFAQLDRVSGTTGARSYRSSVGSPPS